MNKKRSELGKWMSESQVFRRDEEVVCQIVAERLLSVMQEWCKKDEQVDGVTGPRGSLRYAEDLLEFVMGWCGNEE